MYGLGGGKDYQPYSCERLVSWPAPHTWQCHGCPYKNLTRNGLRPLLHAAGLSHSLPFQRKLLLYVLCSRPRSILMLIVWFTLTSTFCIEHLLFSLTHTLTQSLSLALVVMMRSKELKTKIYSHADSQILSSFSFSSACFSSCFSSLFHVAGERRHEKPRASQTDGEDHMRHASILCFSFG